MSFLYWSIGNDKGVDVCPPIQLCKEGREGVASVEGSPFSSRQVLGADAQSHLKLGRHQQAGVETKETQEFWC